MANVEVKAHEESTEQEIDWEGGNRPFNARYGKLMMWYFLLSDAFTFTSFLVAYGMLRFSAEHWPDPNQVFHSAPFGIHNAPLAFVSVMTFILILSSVFVVRAVQEGHRLNQKGVVFWLGLGILGGVAFLGCQAWEWSHLHHEGLWFNNNALRLDLETGKNWFPSQLKAAGLPLDSFTEAPVNFTNLFFYITGFHGLHVLSGIVINIIAWIKAAKGEFQRKKDYEFIEKIGLYWHFVDLVWVFVFLCFYLL